MTIPTAVKDAKGAYLKNPARKPKGEPRAKMGIGSPPTCLTKDEKKTWRRIEGEIAPGVLQSSDRSLFLLFVKLMTKLYLNQPMRVMEGNQMMALGAKFGLSPCDRAKVSVDKPPESKLALFLARKPVQPINKIEGK